MPVYFPFDQNALWQHSMGSLTLRC